MGRDRQLGRRGCEARRQLEEQAEVNTAIFSDTERHLGHSVCAGECKSWAKRKTQMIELWKAILVGVPWGMILA